MPGKKSPCNRVEKQIKHIERELAKLAPPKVENYEFTVCDIISIEADSGSVAGLPRIGRIAITGNGYTSYQATSSTPNPAYRVAQEA
jgi:hypothetical protein